MKITFFGHSDFRSTDELQARALNLIYSIAKGRGVEFLLGEYGGFDSFAYRVASLYKEENPCTALTFVTPYIDTDYNKLQDSLTFRRFDSVVYPELERVPRRFAISQRNRWMIRESDAVIAYVAHGFGGAYRAYSYALSKKKPVYNLAEI